MRVNIAMRAPDVLWIGGRLARELALRLPMHGIEAAINAPGPTDLTYQVFVYGAPDRRPAVGLFTHGDYRPRRYAAEYDGHVALNETMRGYLIEGGAADPAVIGLPVDGAYRRTAPLVFGVSGRTYSDGRKGETLVESMVGAGFTVRAWGSGWPCPIASDRLEDLPAFYRSIDYYVETSTDEGGGVGLREAAATGKPVISHTVGLDLPVIPYERGDWPSLLRVLKGLTRVATYDDWAREHARYFKAVAARLEVAA